MKVKLFVLGPLQTSCYLIYNKSSNAIIIDAGGDPEEMIKFIKLHKLNPVYLVNTHGHIDHIMGNPRLKKEFPQMKICIHHEDARMLEKSKFNLSPELGFDFSSPKADRIIKEGDSISLSENDPDSASLEVIHLPGHTRGGIGLVYRPSKADKKTDGNPVIFSGDAIFAGSIGRTDFPGGSHQELIKNIREKIFILPDETIIFPGHGPMTNVGEEKETNPFF